MTLTVLDRAGDLLDHRESIFALFAEAFDRDLDSATWEWLFLQNPNGPSLVALWHETGRLVGHTALVPFRFSNGASTDTAYRSGTTMISSSAQRPALMGVLGQALQSRCAEEGRIVFGFPNANSWRGFKRFLRWDVNEGALVDLPGSAIVAMADSLCVRDDGTWRLDMDDSEQLRWRLAKPGVTYSHAPGLVSSFYGGVQQVLLIDAEGLLQLDQKRSYRVFLGADHLPAPAVQIYRFGYWRPPGDCLLDRLGPPQLLWSDVF